MGDWNSDNIVNSKSGFGEPKPLPRRRQNSAHGREDAPSQPPLSAERAKRRPAPRPDASSYGDDRSTSGKHENIDFMKNSPRTSGVMNSPRKGPTSSPITHPTASPRMPLQPSTTGANVSRNYMNSQNPSMDKPRSDLSLLKSRIRRHAKATQQQNNMLSAEPSHRSLAPSESSKSSANLFLNSGNGGGQPVNQYRGGSAPTHLGPSGTLDSDLSTSPGSNQSNSTHGRSVSQSTRHANELDNSSAGFGRPPPLKNRQKRVEKKTIENEYLSVGDNRGQSVVEDLNPFSRRSSGEEDKMPSQPPAAGGPLREKRVGVTNSQRKSQSAVQPKAVRNSYNEQFDESDLDSPAKPRQLSALPQEARQPPAMTEYPVDAPGMEGAFEEIVLTPCPDCGRKFKPGPNFDKHRDLCLKQQSKRKAFDMTKQRISDNPEQAQLLAKASKEEKQKERKAALSQKKAGAAAAQAAAAKKTKWKDESEKFREAMKNDRVLREAVASGKELPPVVPSGPDLSLTQCPHCQRRFNAKAAERHIPQCQNIKAKPSSLKKGSGTTTGMSSSNGMSKGKSSKAGKW